MRWVTRYKFAAITGISKKSASNAVARGDVTFREDGGQIKVDLESPLTKQYMAKFEKKKSKKGKAPAATKTKPAPKTNETEEAGQESMPDIDLDEVAGVLSAHKDQLSKPMLEQLKLIEQIRGMKQKTDTARMKLIERDFVAQVFAKIYAVDVNEFRTLGANLAPVVCSIAGVDSPEISLQIEKAIEERVFKVLAHVKRIIDDFLKSIEAEPLA